MYSHRFCCLCFQSNTPSLALSTFSLRTTSSLCVRLLIAASLSLVCERETLYRNTLWLVSPSSLSSSSSSIVQLAALVGEMLLLWLPSSMCVYALVIKILQTYYIKMYYIVFIFLLLLILPFGFRFRCKLCCLVRQPLPCHHLTDIPRSIHLRIVFVA